MSAPAAGRVDPTQWRGIVFDLDDTLYAEREYVLSGFCAVARWAEERLGIAAAESETELRQLFEAGVRGDTFNRWLRIHGCDEAMVPRALSVYREHTPTIEPVAEVIELLEWLRRDYRVGLVSDGYLDVQKAKFGALKLEAYFDAVVFSDEWGREHWKPSVKPFETVAQRLGLHPAQLAYVADNPVKDFYGARRVGMATIQLRREGGEYCSIEPPDAEHAPDLSITTLSELRSLLSRGARSSRTEGT